MDVPAYSALIVACEYSIGLSRLPKVLARAGCRVVVLGPAHSLAARSRYTTEFISTGPEPQDVVASLRSHLNSVPPYDFITLGDDGAMLAMADHWDQPWVEEWFPFPRLAAAVAISTNKLSFGDAMLAAGASYPQSLNVNTLDCAAEAATQLGYPVVLKAAHGYLGSFVRVVDGPAQLKFAFLELISTGTLQVQKYIDGRVGCTAALYDRGRPVALASSFKSECFPDKTGASCVREFIAHPDMQEVCTQVGRITGYHGFAGVDWVLDAAGKLHVIEFNARPIPGYHFCKNAVGVDFSEALRAMIAGERPPLVSHKSGAKIFMFPQHLLRCSSERDWRGLARYFPLCGKMDLPWDDYQLLIEPARKMLAKLFRRPTDLNVTPARSKPASAGAARA